MGSGARQEVRVSRDAGGGDREAEKGEEVGEREQETTGVAARGGGSIDPLVREGKFRSVSCWIILLYSASWWAGWLLYFSSSVSALRSNLVPRHSCKGRGERGV